MSSGQIIIAILFGGFGVVMTFAGLVKVTKTRRFVAAANSTAGRVVAYKTEVYESTNDTGRAEKHATAYPIVEFKDAKGTQRRVTTSTGSAPASFSVGAAVTVLYDRDNPERAEIDSLGELWLLPTILLGGGALFLFIAIAVWVFNVSVKVSF